MNIKYIGKNDRDNFQKFNVTFKGYNLDYIYNEEKDEVGIIFNSNNDIQKEYEITREIVKKHKNRIIKEFEHILHENNAY